MKPLQLITFLNMKTSGKTTLLTNFAIALAKTEPNKKIALVDLNIYTPDIAYIFNLVDEPKHEYPIFLDEIFRYLSSGEDFDINTILTPIKDIPNLQLICGPRNLKPEFAALNEVHWKSLLGKLSTFDIVLVDTSCYQTNPLFSVLLEQSEHLILVQDQDLFGTSHTAQTIRLFASKVRNKMELWVSRYEKGSPLQPEAIEELIDLKVHYCIPDIPRTLYLNSIFADKPLIHRSIPNYTEHLVQIANDLLGNAKPQKGESKWKLLNLRKKLTNI